MDLDELNKSKQPKRKQYQEAVETQDTWIKEGVVKGFNAHLYPIKIIVSFFKVAFVLAVPFIIFFLFIFFGNVLYYLGPALNATGG